MTAIFSLYRNMGLVLYFAVHLVSVILGLFLSIVGALTFLEFRTMRLLLVFCAFSAVTVAELVSLVSFAVPILPLDNGLDSLIVHLMILLMLSFFSLGIFRSD